MFQTITRGDLGLLAYAFEERARPLVIAGTVPGETRAEVEEAFGRYLRVRPTLQRPLKEIVLSPHADDRLSISALRALVCAYMAHQGYARAAWVAVVHQDGGVVHVHVIVVRFDVDGMLIDDGWERTHGRRFLRDWEEEHALVRTRERADERAPTVGERGIQRGVGRRVGARPSFIQEYRALIEPLASRCRTMSELATELHFEGIQIRLRQEDRAIVGISYASIYRSRNMPPVAGHHLGYAYTWQGLQQRFSVSYDPARDATDRLLNPGAAVDADLPAAMKPRAHAARPASRKQEADDVPRARDAEVSEPQSAFDIVHNFVQDLATKNDLLRRSRELRERRNQLTGPAHGAQRAQLDLEVRDVNEQLRGLAMLPERRNAARHLVSLEPDEIAFLEARYRSELREVQRTAKAMGIGGQGLGR